MQSQQTLIVSQSLELGAELGQGEFGSVLKGIWTDPKGNKVNWNVSDHSLSFNPCGSSWLCESQEYFVA